MSVQQFCLRWNNHQPNFISVFSTLLHNETLVDVTLAAEGRQLQAHKVVLSACSSYFQSLFTSNPCQHPIVILKDVQYNHLKTMVDFMYYGEVNVSQEQLPHILKTAEMLKIKGLAEMPDATSLTKSDSKTSLEQQEQIQQSSSGDSIWVSTESQQQQQQQQQFHQQQQHHQQHQQQQRRTPSPGSLSPSARRKRLRKSSTGSGSTTERTSEEQSSIEGGSSTINMSQIDPLSFGGSSGTSTNLSNTRILKESSSTETEIVHLETSQDVDDTSAHHSSSGVMKSEGDIVNVSQTMPLDITGTTTPGNQTPCPQSQSQSEKPTITTTTTSTTTMGSKRGRLLIRQPRVKKDNDHLTGHSSSPDVDPDNHQLHLHQQQQHQHHHHHQQQQQQHNPTYTTRYLQIPPKIERHASEPAPSTITLLSPHLLSVPQPSFLVKQHSHPVLPSQQSQSPPITTYTLQRQLSHPVTTQTTQISQLTTDTIGNISTTLAQLVASSIKAEDDCLLVRTKYQHQHQQQSQPQQQQSQQHQQQISPTVVIVTDPMQPSDQNVMPSIRVKTEELQRSISTPQATRELSVENPRSSHCPVVRDGPALGCNFCWNTIDGHGRILRRKTKYHCPECQTNLCIVPCFQEYHERQANDTTNNDNNSTTSTTATTKNLQPATLRHYPKTGSL